MLAAAVVGGVRSSAALDLVFTVSSPGSFTANQLAIVNQAIVHVERMWETMLPGYQPGISIPSVPITIVPTNSGLGSASLFASANQGGFSLSTGGEVNLNTLQLEPFASWQGDEPNGLNFVDELLAHEVGHVLGIGTLWISNGDYQLDTFRYTGEYGVAAYQAEFNHSILYAPVENAGSPGTPNAHWDQRMRSSILEGTGSTGGDPFLLDPRVGVVDALGRDRGLELMTGAIDPDWREPFIARFTIQSMRDLGYVVTEFEDFNGDGAVNLHDRAIVLANQGMTGLQIDSMTFGDANRDRMVNMDDFRLWQVAAGVPEPSSMMLGSLMVVVSWQFVRGARKQVT